MTCRSVVVDRYDGVGILFAECADHIVCTLLHLGIGTLYSVELDT